MLDFEKWIVDVAVNGVKSGTFGREWAAMQLGNHYSRGKISTEALQRFDTAMEDYESQMTADQEEISDELIEIATNDAK